MAGGRVLRLAPAAAAADGRAVVARADGVTAIAGTEFGSTSSYLRLSYAAIGAADIPEGIARLGRAAHEESRRPVETHRARWRFRPPLPLTFRARSCDRPRRALRSSFALLALRARCSRKPSPQGRVCQGQREREIVLRAEKTSGGRRSRRDHGDAEVGEGARGVGGADRCDPDLAPGRVEDVGAMRGSPSMPSCCRRP